MAIDPHLLKARAKRAYELGRLKRALGVASLSLVIVGISLSMRGLSALTIAAGAILFASVFLMMVRGQASARSVAPGLLAGMPPLLLPLVLRCCGHGCPAMFSIGGCVGMACSPICLPACIGAGVVAGVVIGIGTLSESKRPLETLLTASFLAIVAGSLGCIFAGAFGVLGMALGMLAASAPLAAVLNRRWRPKA